MLEDTPSVPNPKDSGQDLAMVVDQLWSRLDAIGSSPLSIGVAYELYGTDDPLKIAEHVIRTYVSDGANIETRIQEIPNNLDGALISVIGCRRLLLGTHLDVEARIFFYFHSLGHIVHGHLEPEELDLRVELLDRSPMSQLALGEEIQADEWALRVLNRPENPASPFTTGVRNAILHTSRRIIIPPSN